MLTVAKAVETMEQGSMSLLEFGHILHASARTLRRIAARSLDEELEPGESHRLREVRRILNHARMVFDDNEHDALAWFSAPNRALAGKSPRALLKTEGGARMVDDLLTRVEFGVYS